MLNKLKASCLLLIILIPLLQLGCCNAASSSKVTVLAYHDIVNIPASSISNSSFLPVSEFELQMKYLYDHHFNIITLGQLEDFVINKKPLPDKSVLITFDDGYKGVYEYAYPVLKKYHFKAAVFLITSKINNSTSSKMTFGKLAYLNRVDLVRGSDVFEYGFHTHNLHSVDGSRVSRLLTENQEGLENDIKLGRNVITTKYFAYPYGQYDARILSFLRNRNYTLAFSVQKGYIQQSDDPLRLKRFPIFSNTSLGNFLKIVSQSQ